MSEKLYTAAEVAEMIAAERAKITGPEKPVKIYAHSGTFKPTSGKNKGEEVAFNHVRIEGNFYPAKLSFAAAKAVLANVEMLRKVVETPAVVPVAKVDANAPRLVAKAS